MVFLGVGILSVLRANLAIAIVSMTAAKNISKGDEIVQVINEIYLKNFMIKLYFLSSGLVPKFPSRQLNLLFKKTRSYFSKRKITNMYHQHYAAKPANMLNRRKRIC